jgi:glycosyl hydrolase family 115 (putative glucuronidase)/glycosyl hydrolase family 115
MVDSLDFSSGTRVSTVAAPRCTPGLVGALLGVAACAAPTAPHSPGGEHARSGGSGYAVAPTTPSAAPSSASRRRVPHEAGPYVAFEPGPGRFALVAGASATPVVISSSDAPGVQRAARDFAADIGRVSSHAAPLALDAAPPRSVQVVLVGTIDRSPLIAELEKAGKLDLSELRGRWEMAITEVVEAPLPGIERALVIAGSDPRGTIFGLYDLSRRIGVSPWYYWDDVPARQHAAVYVLPGRHTEGEPAVKYRGFFINDEDPALGTWARNTFGDGPNPKHPNGFGHELYAKVFEVLLRLKGNYLWPAVWSRSLFDDDPRNQALAAEYGVVMGTSHEAPMMRAQDEWNRYGQANGPYGGTGEFSFVRNGPALERYWADGIRRMNGYESIITVGMRGNGDTGMEDAQGIELMQRIVSTQRRIIQDVTHQDPASVPQVWSLYKEVQQYWEDGMRAPDDVIINWCDDNWGNMRKLPDPAIAMRSGGYGLYYHFDYVGGGRNYKWNDTTPLPNVWEQLHLSFESGVERMWMVNVGDLKNDEHPLQFFLDYAWDPARLPIERLAAWEVAWAEAQFGPEVASDVARLLERYGQLQSRRKPELLNRVITLDPALDIAKTDQAVVYRDGSPFSLTHYAEAERATAEWKQLARDSDAIEARLPPSHRDAYFQLVHYPVKSTANVYELRLAQFQNLLYAAQGRASSLTRAATAEARLKDDQALSARYDREISGGKWKGFQTQAKLGYGGPYPESSWQQPPKGSDFIWPPLARPSIPLAAELGVAVDGSEEYWSATTPAPATLPELSPYQTQPRQYVEVFNRGQKPFRFRIDASVPWLTATPREGTVTDQVRADVRVDWARAPKGTTPATLTISGPSGSRVMVQAVVKNPDVPRESLVGFVESNGYVSIEAEHFARSVQQPPVFWQLLPNIGRTGSGVTPFPATAARQVIDPEGARLEYDVHLWSAGPVTVWAYLSPRNNVRPTDGLKYAVSFDGAEPQVVNVTTALNGIPMNRSFERNTSDNVNLTSTEHHIAAAGAHVLKFWAIDPTVVLQKLVIDTGGLKSSYLGPPESYHAAGVTRTSVE